MSEKKLGEVHCVKFLLCLNLRCCLDFRLIINNSICTILCFFLYVYIVTKVSLASDNIKNAKFVIYNIPVTLLGLLYKKRNNKMTWHKNFWNGISTYLRITNALNIHIIHGGLWNKCVVSFIYLISFPPI